MAQRHPLACSRSATGPSDGYHASPSAFEARLVQTSNAWVAWSSVFKMWANSDLDFRWFRVFEVNGPGLQMLFWKVHGGRTCPTGEVCSKLFGLRAMLFLVVTFLWIAVVVGKTTGAFLAGSASSTSIYPATIWAWGWFASTFSMLFIARAVHSAQHPSAS